MEERKTFFEKNMVILKMMIIGFLALVLLIPLSMVHSLINERQVLYDSTVDDIAQSYGSDNALTGPIISVPFKVPYKVGESQEFAMEYIYIIPSDLAISGVLDTSIRRRSIYELMAYSTDLKMTGTFNIKDVAREVDIDPDQILWDEATVNIGVQEIKGLRDRVHMQFGDSSLDFKPGIQCPEQFQTGTHARIPIQEGNYDFEVDLKLKGSKMLQFYPTGRNVTVSLSSKCPNPGFFGEYLPNYELNEEGFSADWSIVEGNRNIPQYWRGGSFSLDDSRFGLSLFLDIEHYQKTYRSVKYAMLLVCLSFLSFFFIEVLNGRKLHPVQYSLIGLVMVVFYVLLLSFSEVVGFDKAYLISAVSVLTLLFIYIQSALKSFRLASLLCFILAAVYGFIYVILQLATYSLVVGSVGLFIFLALIMILTRKVDWYNLGQRKQSNDREA